MVRAGQQQRVRVYIGLGIEEGARLGGGVWTADRQRGKDVARRIRTGGLQVNGAAHDFAAPFGGYKASGIGREFAAAGLEEYVELKAIAA